MQKITIEKELLVDVYIALKDFHFFTNAVQINSLSRKDIQDIGYECHTLHEATINNFKNTLETLCKTS